MVMWKFLTETSQMEVQMIKKSLIALAIAPFILVGAGGVAGAATSHAVPLTTNPWCGFDSSGDGYTIVEYHSGTDVDCYADAGDLTIHLENISHYEGGNNAGYLEESNGTRHYFAKNQSYDIAITLVTKIHID
jgi:hypothetical protein